MFLFGCDYSKATPVSDSGISKARITVPTDNDGHSVEQKLIMERLQRDNKPGSIKYVYVINAYTGTVMYSSTARGKVVSSGKRLSPTSVLYNSSLAGPAGCMQVSINGTNYCTSEVLQEDGTYGSSTPYLFWFDVENHYHQIYSDAVYPHISDQPIKIRNSYLTMEMESEKDFKPYSLGNNYKNNR
jgi:hypothetical protein